jgi:hypothetical protein
LKKIEWEQPPKIRRSPFIADVLSNLGAGGVCLSRRKKMIQKTSGKLQAAESKSLADT